MSHNKADGSRCPHFMHLLTLTLLRTLFIQAQKDVLHDFFTHAFDGSGGDNFFDAGNLIIFHRDFYCMEPCIYVFVWHVYICLRLTCIIFCMQTFTNSVCTKRLRMIFVPHHAMPLFQRQCSCCISTVLHLTAHSQYLIVCWSPCQLSPFLFSIFNALELENEGSCIDGRLTSAWHWCSQLSSKPYFPLFKLTGFLSFDGQFDTWYVFTRIAGARMYTMPCNDMLWWVVLQNATSHCRTNESIRDPFGCFSHIHMRCMRWNLYPTLLKFILYLNASANTEASFLLFTKSI